MSTTFEYAPAPESRAIVDIKPSYGLFIDGDFVDGHGEGFKTLNPATEEVLAEISEATDADVDLAVHAARKAFRSWSRISGAERGKYLFRIARIIAEPVQPAADAAAIAAELRAFVLAQPSQARTAAEVVREARDGARY